MRLVDTHCHLDIAPLSADPAAVVERAQQAEVTAVIALAYDLASFDAVEQLGVLPGVALALGLHPFVASQPLDVCELETRLCRSHAVAVGEIGLDYKIEAYDRTRQLFVLEQQLELARKLGLPVLLHCRGAFDDLLAVLRNAGSSHRGVLHAFSRGRPILERFLELGFHVGFGGAVTHPAAQRARLAAQSCPLERLLLETDAPSIGLEGVPAEQVEPRHVRDIATCLAAARGLALPELAERTTANAVGLFGPALTRCLGNA